MEMGIAILLKFLPHLISIVVAACGVATLALLVKLNRNLTSRNNDEAMQRMLAEQSDNIVRKIQLVREELARVIREQLTENRMELSSRVEELRKEVAGNQALQLQQIQETLNRNLLTTNEGFCLEVSL